MSEYQLTDDDILKFTQAKRRELVDVLLAGGMPTDKDGQQMLLQTLGDMDRTALGNKRIGAAEKLAESDRLVADAVLKINRQFGARSPFEASETVDGEVIPPTPILEKLPKVETVPGETAIGISDLKYEEFMDSMEKDD
jgi:hypothetical protein